MSETVGDASIMRRASSACGIPNAEEHFVKLHLVLKIHAIMKDRGLKQTFVPGHSDTPGVAEHTGMIPCARLDISRSPFPSAEPRGTKCGRKTSPWSASTRT